MKNLDWARIGPPLLEQDAEFLAQLMKENDIPADIDRSDDEAELASGLCYFVRVAPAHAARARRVRAQHFTDKRAADAKQQGKSWHWGKREMIGAGAATGGCLLGIPIAFALKGGVFLAVVAGGALSTCAMLLTLVITLGTASPQSVQQQGTGAAPTQIAARKDAGVRRKT